MPADAHGLTGGAANDRAMICRFDAKPTRSPLASGLSRRSLDNTVSAFIRSVALFAVNGSTITVLG